MLRALSTLKIRRFYDTALIHRAMQTGRWTSEAASTSIQYKSNASIWSTSGWSKLGVYSYVCKSQCSFEASVNFAADHVLHSQANIRDRVHARSVMHKQGKQSDAYNTDPRFQLLSVRSLARCFLRYKVGKTRQQASQAKSPWKSKSWYSATKV